ncbi:MAG: PQQ-binding-like beta-propeller repeat protein [Pirellulales bacterium]|nr:PQQ-binding-like beta-propeller repeat protein [Pirellulales bacterium]
MRRHRYPLPVFRASVLFALSLLCGLGSIALGSPLITHTEAGRHGLKRAWFAQVRLDPSRSRVTHVQFVEKSGKYPDTLFVQTDAATVHAFDAETGQTLWVRTVGKPQQPNTLIGANQELVAVFNGGVLYLLDRGTGRTVRRDSARDSALSVPVAGPALNSHRLFVPMADGRVMAFRLDQEKDLSERAKEAVAATPKRGPAGGPMGLAEPPGGEPEKSTIVPLAADKPKPEGDAPPKERLLSEIPAWEFAPLTCVSFGRVTSQPVITREDKLGEYVAWTTSRGLFVGFIDIKREREFVVRFHLSAVGGIVAHPMFVPSNSSDPKAEGTLLTVSTAGKVFAVPARNGVPIWKQPLGSPVDQPPVPIGQRVYVAMQFGGMYALELKNGSKVWFTRGPTEFVAASKDHVYAADADGRILVLDAKTGDHVDTLATEKLPLKLRNIWNDRLYLVTPTGLIQCLHEIGLEKPLDYRHPAAQTPDDSGKKPDPFKEAPEGSPTKPNPFKEEVPEAPPGKLNPFDEEPKGQPGKLNPFGEEPGKEEPGKEDPF